MPVISLEVDMREYPESIIDSTGQILVLGDLHGNAMKLFYFIIKHNVATLSDTANYKKAWEIYEKKEPLVYEDISNFQAIIDTLIVRPLPLRLIFIGDELADRGRCDLLTLLIFNKLGQTIDYEVLLSNHGTYAINYFEKREITLWPLYPGQLASLETTIDLLDDLDIEYMYSVLMNLHLQHMRALSYHQLEDGSLDIFSHAPITRRILEELAFNVQHFYDDSTPERLIETLCAINESLKMILTERTFTDRILDQESYEERIKSWLLFALKKK
jgi:hypothetical protein